MEVLEIRKGLDSLSASVDDTEAVAQDFACIHKRANVWTTWCVRRNYSIRNIETCRKSNNLCAWRERVFTTISHCTAKMIRMYQTTKQQPVYGATS
jgi:hypothetical protein